MEKYYRLWIGNQDQPALVKAPDMVTARRRVFIHLASLSGMSVREVIEQHGAAIRLSEIHLIIGEDE